MRAAAEGSNFLPNGVPGGSPKGEGSSAHFRLMAVAEKRAATFR